MISLNLGCKMESLPNELLDSLAQLSETKEKIVLSEVSSRWHGVIVSRIDPIENLKDLKRACIKGDLFSIIRSKCHQWVHKIIEWSLRSGKTEIYDWLVENEYDVSSAWMGCYWGGHRNLIERLFPKLSREGSEIALRKGHSHTTNPDVPPEMIEELVHVGALISKFNQACGIGNIEVVKSMPNFPFQSGISLACRGGHYELLVYLTQKGISVETWKLIQESCIIGACEKGNIRVIEHLISLGVITSWGSGLIAACRKNKVQAAELMIRQGTTCYNGGLVAACKNGALEAAKLMYSYGARTLDQALVEAVGLDIIKWLIQKGATNNKAAMFQACKYGRYHEALYLKQFMPFSVATCLELANYRTVAEYHNKKRIVKLLSD